MKKLAIVSQTALGRAAIGFIGTAFVLLVTPLLTLDQPAGTHAAVQLSDGPAATSERPS